jgi:P-type Ca2+ transporter type 2C
VFTVETYADRRLLTATGLSAVAILFGTEVGIFQRILGTVSLTGGQWVTCILGALSIVVASELRKLVLRRKAAGRGAGVPQKEAEGTVALPAAP